MEVELLTKEGNFMEDRMDYLKLLKEILQQEYAKISSLVKLEEEKFEALKQVDVSLLMKINNQEEDILHQMNFLEKKRKDIIKNLASIYNFNPDLSLKEILDYLPESDSIPSSGQSRIKEEIMEIRESIKRRIAGLQTTLHENSEIIKANMEIINLTLNFANRNSLKETYDYRLKKESKDTINLVNQIA